MPTISASGIVDPLSDAKDADEAYFDAWLRGTLDEQYTDLQSQLNKKDPQDPPQSWWDKWASTLTAFMVPFFTGLAIQSASGSGQAFGFIADGDTINREAANWASTYVFGLVNDLNSARRAALQESLVNFYGGSLDYSGVVSNLSFYFGPDRAEMIAKTEVNRGYNRGVNIYEDELRAAGLNTDQIWRAEADACQICLPNNDLPRSSGMWTVPETPAHPNCRCFVEVVTV